MKTCRLTIKAAPGSRVDSVDGMLGDAIKIRLRAPAVDGKANKALLDLLAQRLDLHPRDIRLVTGQTARLKIIEIAGRTEDEARQQLLGDPTLHSRQLE
ncbi:MAG: hypothetical protein DRP71_06955 [Verrucomicrobia bacterium]|nr:MAG: hypothetical protein DRP71_06955 [Verrucomicrobiota bacterium]